MRFQVMETPWRWATAAGFEAEVRDCSSGGADAGSLAVPQGDGMPGSGETDRFHSVTHPRPRERLESRSHDDLKVEPE
jgi:hypothetical protein